MSAPSRIAVHEPDLGEEELQSVLEALRRGEISGSFGKALPEFEERFARAKKWLLTHQAYSGEEHCMQLNALASAGATAEERAPYIMDLKALQNADGSWSQTPQAHGEAYATGEALYALHISGNVPTDDPVYQKGVQWLLRNQLADGSWFVPAKTTPSQPNINTGFPHGPDQFISAAGTAWAIAALVLACPAT